MSKEERLELTRELTDLRLLVAQLADMSERVERAADNAIQALEREAPKDE